MQARHPAAVAAGLTEHHVAHLSDPEVTDLSPREQAGVRFAYQFATNHESISPEQVTDLSDHFSHQEIIELGMLCAQFVGFGRLVKVLGMEMGMTCPLPRADDAGPIEERVQVAL
jgi:alkylhydroperoxidase family enzyme